MPWYIYLAFKQLFPHGKKLPFFTILSVLGVTLGVMVLIVVQSVMNGFSQEMRSKIIDTHGHIRIESEEGIIYNTQAIIPIAEKHPSIQGISKFAQGIIMIQYDNRPAFPMIRGIDLQEGEHVIPVEDFLIAGQIEDLDDDSIFVSSTLARNLNIYVGSMLDAYSPLTLEKLKRDEVMLPRELLVTGIFETGWNQIDSNSLICSLRLMQELYGLGNGVHGIAIRLKPNKSLEKAVQALNQQLPEPLHASSWIESNRDFLFVLRLEKTVLFFITLFIILVASFSITSSLMTSVVRKTKEIGLLNAIGGKRSEIAMLFCFQGLIIGTLGTILGVGLAMLALHFRNEIVYLFAQLTQSRETLVQFYQFSTVPLHYSKTDFILIITSAICISTLAGFFPAIRASRLKPSEALRSEY